MQFLDKTQLLKMAEHVFRRGNGVPDKKLMHPRREWVIGLGIFFVIVVAGSAYSAQSFSRYINIDTSDGEANVNIPRYDKNEVQAVLEMYAKRATEYEARIATRAFVPPPATSTPPAATSTPELPPPGPPGPPPGADDVPLPPRPGEAPPIVESDGFDG